MKGDCYRLYGKAILKKMPASDLWESCGGFSKEEKKNFYRAVRALQKNLDAVASHTYGAPPEEEAETVRRALLHFLGNAYLRIVVRGNRMLVQTVHDDHAEFGVEIDLEALIVDHLEWVSEPPFSPSDIADAKGWRRALVRMRATVDKALLALDRSIPMGGA